MKIIIITLISIIILIPTVNAHAIDKEPVIKSTGNYNIQFLIYPKFPVTGKDTHLDFVIKDKSGNLISNLNIEIELDNPEKAIAFELKEKEKGHYSKELNFNDAGNYEVHISINEGESEAEFNLEIDDFGLSGLLRAGIIIILLVILIRLMVKDCRRKENG